MENYNGNYYLFDCMDGLLGDRFLLPEEVHEIIDGKRESYTEKQLIRIAANYEASLYRYTFKDGEQIENKLLYDCGY